MKRKRKYKIPHRRRREQKTNYRKRLKLLKSKKPRLAIRKSANNLTCQVISYHPTGDRTLVTANCRKLKELGWKGHGGNIPAAYLVGFLAALEARKKGVKSAVADIPSSDKWSRFYAALKGAIDGGLEIPHSPEVLPPDDIISGGHISRYAMKLRKESPDKYKKLFSSYLKSKLLPEGLPKHFEEVKKKIV
jgi:large subunit ribosomal protein L18